MRKVVEHQAAYRNLLNVEHAAGLWQMLQSCILGMERQRNKCLEAVSLVLQRPQFQQVVNAILVIFNVTVKHRRI